MRGTTQRILDYSESNYNGGQSWFAFDLFSTGQMNFALSIGNQSTYSASTLSNGTV
jgi:hypothetical protein